MKNKCSVQELCFALAGLTWSAALKDFLKIEQIRPIYARVAFDNYSSQKVLEKCGFIKIGKEKDLLMPGKLKSKNIFINFQADNGQ